jgi:hypothetical protein
MKYEMYEFTVITAPSNGCKRYFTVDSTCLSTPDLYLATYAITCWNYRISCCRPGLSVQAAFRPLHRQTVLPDNRLSEKPDISGMTNEVRGAILLQTFRQVSSSTLNYLHPTVGAVQFSLMTVPKYLLRTLVIPSLQNSTAVSQLAQCI